MNQIILKLKSDYKEALKNKEAVKKSVLSLVIGNYQLAEKEKKAELTEQEAIGIVQKELKQVEESLDAYKKGNRADLVEIEEEKLAILKTYLPAMMTETEIREIVEKELEHLDRSNKGLVMKTLMPLFKGKADGKLVNKIITEMIK